MHKSGFSLVELSIVLVILGLLTGGILGGQSLIHAAELRAVTTEFSQWQTAVNTFKQKYFALPGDFSKATQFWGADDCPPDVGDVLTATCNGNGNGRIAQHDEWDELVELFLFWQHLAKAGLISGTYTGVRGADSGWQHIAGVNSPVSKYSGATWGVESNGDHVDIHYNLDTTNAFVFGANGSWELAYEPVLTAEEAWNIDTKLDDGMPGKGNVIAINYAFCDTATGQNDFDGVYKVSANGVRCSLYFRNGI